MKVNLSTKLFFTLLRRIKYLLLKREEGSAVVEFLALGLPLFLPLAIFLSHINNDSNLHIQSKNLARQVVRAFVTSPSEQYSESRVAKVIEVFQREIFNRSGATSNPTNNSAYGPEVRITCSQYPCLQRGTKVRATVTLSSANNQVVAVASAEEFVDLWRSS